MAIKKKTELSKPTEMWGDIFKAQDNKILSEEGGEVYKVQPVDLLTFVGHKDYLGMDTYNPCLSEEQLNFLEAMSDFENKKTLGILWVGKGGNTTITAPSKFL